MPFFPPSLDEVQVFEAFLASFTTYRSHLGRAKAAYDIALDDALSSTYDNAHMKADLDQAKTKLVRGCSSVASCNLSLRWSDFNG
jgi:hypothetical protein